MKHLKIFEEFHINLHREKYPKKEFDKFTLPIEPYKRKLTDEETKFLFKNFLNHSWSNVDAEGRIILGGGNSHAGKFYITEDDIAKFMEEELNDSKEN